jgi:hypothetical protein
VMRSAFWMRLLLASRSAFEDGGVTAERYMLSSGLHSYQRANRTNKILAASRRHTHKASAELVLILMGVMLRGATVLWQ